MISRQPKYGLMDNNKENGKTAMSMYLNGAQLNYLRFKDYLVNLGLLSDIASMQSESKERALLYDLWKILRGEINEFVMVENLRVAVQVIVRLIDLKRVLNIPSSESDQQRSES